MTQEEINQQIEEMLNNWVDQNWEVKEEITFSKPISAATYNTSTSTNVW